MLDELYVKNGYRLRYTNKEGEELEVDLERGSTFFPSTDESEEIVLIRIKRKGQDDLEIAPGDDKFADYEDDIWEQFQKER